MARGGVISRARTAPKRLTEWQGIVGGPTAVTSLAAATSTLVFVNTAGELAKRPYTIVRTRGRLWVRSDQSTGTEAPFGALGMAVINDQAITIGITAIPKPVSDAEFDQWFVWEPWAASVRFGSSVGFSEEFLSYEIDSKAMRKVEEGESLVVVMENQAASHGAQFILQFRQLVKLN